MIDIGEIELINRIKAHELGCKEDAFELYCSLCELLKSKYGLLNRSYDDNPCKRGKEWLDIHHVLEYELDDIARRTDNAKIYERDKLYNDDNQITVAINSAD